MEDEETFTRDSIGAKEGGILATGRGGNESDVLGMKKTIE